MCGYKRNSASHHIEQTNSLPVRQLHKIWISWPDPRRNRDPTEEIPNICHLLLLHWSPEPRQLLLAHLKQPSPQLEYFTNKPHSVLLFETKLAKPQIKVSTAEEDEEVMLLLIDPSCPTSCVVMTGWPSVQIYWSIVMSGNDYYGSGIQLTRYSQ